jgi:hypothetical protein
MATFCAGLPPRPCSFAQLIPRELGAELRNRPSLCSRAILLYLPALPNHQNVPGQRVERVINPSIVDCPDSLNARNASKSSRRDATGKTTQHVTKHY